MRMDFFLNDYPAAAVGNRFEAGSGKRARYCILRAHFSAQRRCVQARYRLGPKQYVLARFARNLAQCLVERLRWY
jgi:hypothetical protein